MKLSEAIRQGIPLVGDNSLGWFSCAAGAAWAGVHGHMLTWPEYLGLQHNYGGSIEKAIADACGWPHEALRKIVDLHSDSMTREACADYAELQGW